MTAEQTALHAERILDRCRTLARFTEVAGTTTRPFLCASARAVQQQVAVWMEEAGLSVRLDSMGNLRGNVEPRKPASSHLLIGSHLDTVPDAGAFDGILGVMLAIEVATALQHAAEPLSFEVVAFSEEEGVRFGRPFLGSLAVIGRASETLAWTDRNGISVAQALAEFEVDPAAPTELAPETAGYLEVHIEQGPVLDSMDQPLAIVDAIAGQSRCTVRFRGQSNHAGTTPMSLRRDALASASEWVVAVEKYARGCPGLVATVGRLDVQPGAGNVVAGNVTATLDVRHRRDAVRTEAVGAMLAQAHVAATRRSVTAEVQIDLDQQAVEMNPALGALLARSAVEATGTAPPYLTSGAGHDAMILAQRVPATMLFVRSPGGLSHHPDESVLPQDVASAFATIVTFLRRYQAEAGKQQTELTHA